MLIESKVLRGADTIAFSNLLSKFQKTITCNYTDFDTDIINNQVQERNNLIL